jgi:hypothetical protein
MFMNLNHLQLETEHSQAVLKIYLLSSHETYFAAETSRSSSSHHRSSAHATKLVLKVSPSGTAHKMANQINSEPLPPWIYALSGSASVVLAQTLLYPFDR